MKYRTIAVLLFFSAPFIWAQNSFSFGIGGNFYRYETSFLDIAATYNHQLQPGLEVNVGVEFGIARDKVDGEYEPNFLVPANLGMNFTFPQDRIEFLVGTGLTPVVNFAPDEDPSFLLGPYLKGGARVRVHRIMRLYLTYQQDLLIGGDDWINASSRVLAGLNVEMGRGAAAEE